ncbi:hypothetical protein [Paenibacillus pini]|uniref:Uncharacterized protein n=1 Tax=Paenibacillus pini JCM 16418 TaxID=1236976 RepID=W7YIJ2_9BACL|nr:hypothetical protein [Paenibacillus pini]GAF10715.1 hypothetical protein JCM16418_4934 [Paenibacillus pini JCM 16418]
MLDELVIWAKDYGERSKEVADILKYHQILPEDSYRAEGRIQAIDDMLNFIEENKIRKGCEYCTGNPLSDRKPLMKSQLSDYSVFINSANYLEDSVIGGSVPHSLYGVKIVFCPVCGKKL